MELAGRKALLTGATGGLGRAIAQALADARRDPDSCSAPAGARRWRRWPRSCPATATASSPADLAEPGAAEQLGRRGRRRRRPRRQRRPARAPGGWSDFSAEQVQAGAAGQPRGADAAGPGAVPGDGRARARATSSSSPRWPARRRARGPPSTTRPSSACAASPSACAPTWRRRASASRSSRPGFIRDAGMFADVRRQVAAGPRDRRRPSRSAPATCGRSSATRSRSPWRRCGSGRSPTSPSPARAIAVADLQSGSAGQKAAARDRRRPLRTSVDRGPGPG